MRISIAVGWDFGIVLTRSIITQQLYHGTSVNLDINIKVPYHVFGKKKIQFSLKFAWLCFPFFMLDWFDVAFAVLQQQAPYQRMRNLGDGYPLFNQLNEFNYGRGRGGYHEDQRCYRVEKAVYGEEKRSRPPNRWVGNHSNVCNIAMLLYCITCYLMFNLASILLFTI